MKTVCVFCSSKSNLHQSVFEQADAFADKLLEKNWALLYGGASAGLMGHFADRVVAGKGTSIGIMPNGAFEQEVAHQSLTELVYTDDMLDRKKLMMDRSDAFVIFPGGIGTMDEALEVLTWETIYKIKKPIVFFNWQGFWDPFLKMLKDYEGTGLFYPETMQAFDVVDSVDGLMEVLNGSR